MVRLLGRVSRVQNYEMKETLQPETIHTSEEICLAYWSYQKVKETAFEVFGRSGGVARFSIAAFRAVDRGFESRPEGGKESLASREAPL